AATRAALAHSHAVWAASASCHTTSPTSNTNGNTATSSTDAWPACERRRIAIARTVARSASRLNTRVLQVRHQLATNQRRARALARPLAGGDDAARHGRQDLPRPRRPGVLAPEARRRRAAHRALGRARLARLPRREHPGGVRRRRPRHVGARDGG